MENTSKYTKADLLLSAVMDVSECQPKGVVLTVSENGLIDLS